MRLPEWPLMLKSTHRAVQVENHVLRDALREANNEIRRYRALLAQVREGTSETIDLLMGVLKK